MSLGVLFLKVTYRGINKEAANPELSICRLHRCHADLFLLLSCCPGASMQTWTSDFLYLLLNSSRIQNRKQEGQHSSLAFLEGQD